MRTYYDILGIAPQATQAEVRQAYRRLAAQLHPDANPSPQAAQRFVLVNEAHAVLSDALRRALYDQHLATAQAAHTQRPRPKRRTRQRLSWRQQYGGIVLLLSLIVLVFFTLRTLSRSIIAPAPQLDLSYRSIAVWPAALTNTREILYLNLAHNDLAALPANINTLPALELLNLNHNQLSALPDNLYQLNRLLGLHLAGNRLTSISPRIAQLRQLRILNLAHNRITHLPAELATLPELYELDLRGNPIAASEIDVLRQLLPKHVKLLY